MMGFDYLAGGPRMGLLAAQGLETAGVLQSLHIDGWLRPGLPERVARSVLGPRAQNRVIREIDPSKIHAHPELFFFSHVAHRLQLAGRDSSRIDRVAMKRYEAVARHCSSPAVFGMQYTCVELFKGRECKIVEQFAAPAPVDRLLMQDEQRRFPGWTNEGSPKPTVGDERNRAEWAEADIVWVPSPHLIPLCKDDGADPRKFRVVRYPIPRFSTGTARCIQPGRRLRVIFAGTLMLRKGVQYIYEALRGWNRGQVEMHFFGANQLSRGGAARLAEVGELHGHLSRSELLDEFCRSDVLLLPSISEGSALVMAEAAATGLPVIATPQAGPPDSAIVIEERNPRAIREALERILDDPGFLHTVSQDCLIEARRRSADTFKAEIGALATEALNNHVVRREK